jgi:thioredoxin reductase (NADPH)
MEFRDEALSRIPPPRRAAIVAVDDEARSSERLRTILERRFGADYEILTETTAADAVGTLNRLRTEGRDVALVLAGQWMAEITGVELLARVPPIHRDARRALLTTWGDRLAADWIVKAAALGQIDTYIVRPWGDADEQFCHAITELLDEWDRNHRPQFAAVRIVGERWDAYSHGLQDALQRSNVPFHFYEAESAQGRDLLGQAEQAAELPVAVLFDGRALPRPSPAEIAEALGVNTDPSAEIFDVTIVGAGPAGLAAAVYAASEGLHVLVLENEALGGQAGTSSLIRNYLGFPRGLSGADLTHRAYLQAWMLGARFLIGRAAEGLRAEPDAHVLVLDDGSEIRSRAIVLAVGVRYRRIGIDTLEAFVGRGVFYGAGVTEAPGMADEEVYVVGGANSAAQAALYLSRFAARVTVLVRESSLIAVSDYLVRDIEARDNIAVRLNTVAIEGRGDYRLRSLTIRDTASDRSEEVSATAVFIMIGASPRTGWLPRDVGRDNRGYILTGESAPVQVAADGRPNVALQTSIPGVFAVGDVRSGSMKRVAAAVGEGSTAIRMVHDYIASGGRTAASLRDSGDRSGKR